MATKKTVHKGEPDDVEAAEGHVDEVVTLAEPIEEPSRTELSQSRLSHRQRRLLLGVGLLLLLVGVVGLIKPLRLQALNALFDPELRVIVIDQETKQPVSGVQVTASGESAWTNESGEAILRNTPFGTADISLVKEAYEARDFSVEIDRRRDDAGPFELKPTGIPVAIKAVDKLSGEALKKFSVQLKGTEAAAPANEQGVAVVNVPQSAGEQANLIITAEGYNDYEAEVAVNLQSDDRPTEVGLVAAGRHHFLSNRDGRIGVYSANLDGSDVKRVIKGSGNETNATEFYVSPDGESAVLVASRKGTRRDGELLRELYVVDLKNGKLLLGDEGADDYQVVRVENHQATYEAEFYYFRNNTFDRLKTISLVTAAPAALHTVRELDVQAYRDGMVYVRQQSGTDSHALVKVNSETGQIETVVKKDAFDVSLPTADKLVYAVYEKSKTNWYQYDLASSQTTKLAGRPNKRSIAYYHQSPNRQQSAWVERRDGQGRVIVGTADGRSGEVVEANENVHAIVRWVDDRRLIFNVNTSDETADYLLDVPTGKTQLITRLFAADRYYGGY